MHIIKIIGEIALICGYPFFIDKRIYNIKFPKEEQNIFDIQMDKGGSFMDAYLLIITLLSIILVILGVSLFR
ncbi:hypothetical protein CWS01_02485, partial [Niallia nealsonii]